MQIGPYDTGLVQSNITKLLKKYSNGLWMSKVSEVYSEMFSQTLHPQALINLDKWPHVCMVSHCVYKKNVFIFMYVHLHTK